MMTHMHVVQHSDVWCASHQGWPKFAMSAFVVEANGGSKGVGTGAAADALVVASLVPATATLPASVAGVGDGKSVGKIETDSKYPFGDNVTVTVTGTTSEVTVKIRIPGWATRATVNGRPAANGTLAAVVCPPTLPSSSHPADYSRAGTGATPAPAAGVEAAACKISVALNPEVTIEHGWGFVPNSTDTAPATNGASIVRG